ncbi:hypothetical protein ABHN11_21580 [Brevibacillus centrosporus]|jgi:hypothetical protein|uniref:hypothetical protein n=1 Tax=Brevibacillus centrosporus TaxID=54910 RepID=UPI003987B4AF
MKMTRMIVLLLTIVVLMCLQTSVFAESKQANNELIYKVSGQKPGEMNLDTDTADEATIDSGVAIAEVASKACVIIFFIALLIQLFGKVIQHPGYTKWSRLLIGSTIVGFVIIRMAPVILYGM